MKLSGAHYFGLFVPPVNRLRKIFFYCYYMIRLKIPTSLKRKVNITCPVAVKDLSKILLSNILGDSF